MPEVPAGHAAALPVIFGRANTLKIFVQTLQFLPQSAIFTPHY
jgi:hypothetical protein